MNHPSNLSQYGLYRLEGYHMKLVGKIQVEMAYHYAEEPPEKLLRSKFYLQKQLVEGLRRTNNG